MRGCALQKVKSHGKFTPHCKIPNHRAVGGRLNAVNGINGLRIGQYLRLSPLELIRPGGAIINWIDSYFLALPYRLRPDDRELSDTRAIGERAYKPNNLGEASLREMIANAALNLIASTQLAIL